MRKKILLIVLLLGVLGTSYWLLRSQYRLPFDQVSTFQAVSTNSSVLVGLPDIADGAIELNNQHLWFLDAQRVREVLDSLKLTEGPEWS